MFTVPAKPFCPATVITAGGLMVPTVMESADGFADKLKSGGGGGPDEPPPPQPTTRNATTDAEQDSARNFLEIPNLLFPAFISASLVERLVPTSPLPNRLIHRYGHCR